MCVIKHLLDSRIIGLRWLVTYHSEPSLYWQCSGGTQQLWPTIVVLSWMKAKETQKQSVYRRIWLCNIMLRTVWYVANHLNFSACTYFKFQWWFGNKITSLNSVFPNLDWGWEINFGIFQRQVIENLERQGRNF